MHNAINEFRDAMRSAGLIPPDMIEPGKFHRFPGEGKRNGNSAAWCKLFPDGIGGIYGDYSTGLSADWQAKRETPFTQAESEALKRHVTEAKAQAEAERKAKQSEAACKAAGIWKAAKPAPEDHPYLIRKGIKPSGARIHNDALAIPMRASGEIHSLQFIGLDGKKRFLTGGRVAGCYFSIGNPTGATGLCIAEGFATGATIHEATGLPVAVAFNAGNLGPVAKTMRERFAEIQIILCADDDAATEGNPGITKATEAARSVRGKLAIPDFGTDRPDGATDFNDMAKVCGLEAVKRAIGSASAPAKAEHQPGDGSAAAGDPEGWPVPQALSVKVEPEPYPIDALPQIILAAVEEVAAFVKAPIPMVASSALAALSLAIQPHADVRRLEKLHGPVGLFLLTIADSGERKSTCDGFFTKAIDDYEKAQAEAAKPILKDYKAAIAAWEAQRDGIISAIKQTGKTAKPVSGKDIKTLRADLTEHQHDEPPPPRIPRLLYADATPEALAYGLAKQWPSGGVVSAEAGTVFGSHGMGKDSVMRNLALLNQLWDGRSLTIDRRTSESFTVRGARLTVALQVQEPTLREFISRSGALARGSGFLARFLVAWPESTQGTRQIDLDAPDGPATWPHLDAFHRRMAAILEWPVPIDDDGVLTPPMLTLTLRAKLAWAEHHNAIESALLSGGELTDVRDVASKSADNVARLAALFHVFSSNTSGSNIQNVEIESATRIAAWHLNESRRFFGELALPVELADASRLDTWLTNHCRREKTHFVGKNYTRQHGPIRDGKRVDAALNELAALDRVHIRKDGKRFTIQVNPALLSEAGQP